MSALAKAMSAQPKPAGKPKANKKPRKQASNRVPRNQRNSGANQQLSEVKSNNYTSRRGAKCCVIEEDEYIAEIPGSVAFGGQPYSINPGQKSTFPWLSVQAAQWEKYEFEELEFYYKTELNQFSTQAVGKIMLSADYDASDGGPNTKQQVLDTDPHNDAAPYQAFSLKLNPRLLMDGPRGKQKYVRPGILPGSSDIKTYDAGNLFVTTSGQPATTVLGELHVHYRVRFEVPVLEGAPSGSANNAVASFEDAAPAEPTSGVAVTLPLASQISNGVQAVNTAGSILLQPGTYLIFGTCQVTAATNLQNATLSLKLGANVVESSTFIIASTALMTENTLDVYAAVFVPAGGQAVSLSLTVTGAGQLGAAGQITISTI